jgi:sigma-E factor negative regulatory protein RseC
MDSAVGRIVSVADGRATVAVDAASVCARCAAGKGCGAGLLAGSHKTRLIEVEVTSGTDFKAGDEVRLTLAPSDLLRAAMFAYGLPLGGVVAALGVAWYLNHALNDQVAVALALGGLVVGVLLGRHYLNKDGCLKNLAPSVSARRV